VGGVITFLALLGGVSLALRLLRSIGHVLLGSAEVAAASGMARTSAARGDLTSMVEYQAAERRARAWRRRRLLLAALWLLWIIGPLAAGGPTPWYALAAPLWLLPANSIRDAPAGLSRKGRKPRQRHEGSRGG